ncbi:hypothetical protein GCM10023089_25320 [Quisquiliibacterium transsilvanicum]|uniref:Ribonuclease 3 n=1 Tax=Quisquiliibacterium transsilvanicum TaxID=1549638 RepID=A0A7W8M6V7_9BURK|nr:ribonuclease-3 [Quisquiliibacterium transsilvanicum]
MSLESLQQRLGYSFSDPALLEQALTHRSYGRHNNERLEFLGDSVLNFVVSSLLYDGFGRIDEGDLSRMRANLVNQHALHEIAQRLELSEHLLLGQGDLKSGSFRRPSVLADAAEAVFGAVYLDGGFEAARRVIGALYAPVLKSVDPLTVGKDAKTLLQEYLQGRRMPLPVYAVVATHGAAHNQLFEVECAIPKLGIGVLGSGASRRVAEQAAARLALAQAQSLAPGPGKRRTRSASAGAAAPDTAATGGEGAGQPAGAKPAGSVHEPAAQDLEAQGPDGDLAHVPAALEPDSGGAAALDDRRGEPARVNIQAPR